MRKSSIPSATCDPSLGLRRVHYSLTVHIYRHMVGGSPLEGQSIWTSGLTLPFLTISSLKRVRILQRLFLRPCDGLPRLFIRLLLKRRLFVWRRHRYILTLRACNSLATLRS